MFIGDVLATSVAFVEMTSGSDFETGSIKFTYEMEREGSLPFLDILVTRQQNEQLKLTVQEKDSYRSVLTFRVSPPS